MSQTSGSNLSPPRYWSIATGVITLLSLVAGVLIHRLVPGLVLTVLALVMAAIIWRFRMLWFRGASFLEIGRDRWLWVSGVCTVALGASFLLMRPLSANGANPTIQASPRVAEVNGCMQIHGLKQPYQEVPPQPPSKDEPVWTPLPHASSTVPFRGAALDRRVFAWCDSPPPSWAQADGYTEITVTRLQGLDREAAGVDRAYRIKAPCEKLKIAFTGIHQAIEPLKPFVTKVGSLVTYDGHPWGSGPTAYYKKDDNFIRNAFGPRRNEVVVMSSSQLTFDEVKCLA
jgi:hypothetical protein